MKSINRKERKEGAKDAKQNSYTEESRRSTEVHRERKEIMKIRLRETPVRHEACVNINKYLQG